MRIAVVGGGVAGLAAALRLASRAPAAEIIVYERSGAPGGKLRTGTVAGGPVEFGAEAFLTREAGRPGAAGRAGVAGAPAGGDSAAVELARELGLGGDLVHPATTRAAVAVDGVLHPIPPGTLVGVPGDLAALAPLARVTAAADVDDGRPLLGPDADVAVGALVRRRLGDEVVDRLVDPMLGGVYAGRADDLSLAATMPALARACRTEHTLVGAVRAAMGARRPADGASPPVFTTIAGGLGRLVDAMAAALGPGRLRLGAPVRDLRRTPGGWRLAVGSAAGGPAGGHAEGVDAVVLALPSRPAARLLRPVHPAAAAAVGALDYASVALVTLAVPAPLPPELSGLLVPAAEGTAVKAATFFASKWAHLRRDDGLSVVRASLGRYGEEHLLQRTDEELVATAHAELSRLLRPARAQPGALPLPVGAHVQRWGGALPQYRPGHPGRVAAARVTLAGEHPTLALAGAGYDGVGIPICIRSGQAAADGVLEALGATR